MVDALHAAHRALRPKGLLLDIRPDASRLPRVISRGRIVGGLVQTEEATLDDDGADRAVARVVKDGLFKPIEDGFLWYRGSFEDLAMIDDCVRTSARYGDYASGTRERLARRPDEPVVTRRAIKFLVLERL